jgi:hypothetical protein
MEPTVMTTPIVTETRRNGNHVGNATSGGRTTPATVSTERQGDERPGRS